MNTQPDGLQRIYRKAESDEHVCTAQSCPTGKYYVSCIDGPRWFIMAGPYAEHVEALADANRALKIANDIDGRAWFMAWGTVRMPDDCSKIGILNKHNLMEHAQ